MGSKDEMGSLGELLRAERERQGISLEEVLHSIGRDRPLDYEFTKRFREFWTRQGGTDGIYSHGASP